MSNVVEHKFTRRGDVRTTYEDAQGREVSALVILDDDPPKAYVHPESQGKEDYLLYTELWGEQWRAIKLYRMGTHLHMSELDCIHIESPMSSALDDAVRLWQENNNPSMIIDRMPEYDPDNGSEY